MSEKRTVFVDGKSIAYFLTIKNVKNINLRVRDENVYVSMNRSLPKERSDKFVSEKAEWIFSAIERQKNNRQQSNTNNNLEFLDDEKIVIFGCEYTIKLNKNDESRCFLSKSEFIMNLSDTNNYGKKYVLYQQFCSEKCREIFTDCLFRFFPILEPLGAKKPYISMKLLKSRWGSCKYNTGEICLNFAMIKLPLSLVEYVVLHEAVHLVVPNHSKSFYALGASIMSDFEKRDKALNKYSV